MTRNNVANKEIVIRINKRRKSVGGLTGRTPVGLHEFYQLFWVDWFNHVALI